jgi:beta-lactamase class A
MAFYASSPRAEGIGRALARDTLNRFSDAGLAADRFALTLLLHDRALDGTSGAPPEGFGYQADRPFYPCSVVKVFYLVAAFARLQEGRFPPHEDLTRAMRDMILYSSNMGTNYVIDLVTGTTGDTLLEGNAYAEWAHKRNWVNRFFRDFGWPEFAAINVCQKLMDDQRYGREKTLAGKDGSNHNRLTADATARLFHAIFTGQVINPEISRRIRDLLYRPLDPAWIEAEPASQVKGYFGEGVPPGSRLWSKAGWTGWTRDPAASFRRHDAAYVELPSGRALTLVAFTQGNQISANVACLPWIAHRACELVDS